MVFLFLHFPKPANLNLNCHQMAQLGFIFSFSYATACFKPTTVETLGPVKDVLPTELPRCGLINVS